MTEPDSGGNRAYDYISVEDHDAAEKTLETKEYFNELTRNEIVVLRTMAGSLGFRKDVVDLIDRLALVRCLFETAKNRDEWMKGVKS